MNTIKPALFASFLTLYSCSNSLPEPSLTTSAAVEDSFVVEEDIEVIDVGEEIFSEIAQLEQKSTVSRRDTIYDSEVKIEEHNLQKQERIMEALTQNIHDYEVQPHDTLMLISYKLLGDFRFWRLLEDWNPELQGQTDKLLPGSIIKYDISYKKDLTQPAGLPYLILIGDNLGKVSHKVYDDSGARWRHLYENNRPLIYDPNIIFAGFTLYYQPLELLEADRTPAEL